MIISLKESGRHILAVLLGLALLLIFDFSLALFGIVPLSREDPFVGFQGTLPLLRLEGGGNEGYSLQPAKRAYFNDLRLPSKKAPGTYRFFTFGGSTTYGRPYLGKTSFGTWTRLLLDRYDTGHSH